MPDLDPALAERLRPIFEENFTCFGELGAAISVWQNGQLVCELHGGFHDARREIPWTDETLVIVWSATKGIGSACLLHVLQEQGIGLERAVAEFWPEFAAKGKEAITLAQLLSHQAGLAALDEPADATDFEAVVSALARQAPVWPPGSAHGYHARTFGYLVDELVRRIEGRTLGVYWREVFAQPLALDFWIGLPAELNSRVATIYAAKAGGVAEPAEFYRALATPGTLTRQVFSSPRGLSAVSAMNAPENRARSLVSLGGIGSAHALAKFYALLAHGGELEGRRFFTAKTLAQMKTTLVDGVDRVFGIPTAFSAGFMKSSRLNRNRLSGPSPEAFGHPGAGGSNAFADPEHDISFAYVMNQMTQTLLPNQKSRRLVDEIYRALASS